jgi:ABC-2 type transport system permease protein
VRAWLELYAALLRVSIAGQIQYRAAGAIWMIGSILEPVIFLAVWGTVARARGGAIEGLDPRDFAAYYLTLLFVNHFTFSWVMHVFQYRIQQGFLAFELLRPVHPLHADLADNLAYKLVMLAVLLPAGALIAWSFEPRFAAGAAHWLLFAPALVLALLLRFLSEWTLALLAFWTTRTQALNQIYFSLLVFFSGRVAPVALLPLGLGELAKALPFYWMVGFPVELATGRIEPTDALAGFGAQLGWAALALAGMRAVWASALRRFAAVGT